MKTLPLTARRCPEWLHQALKKSAESNRRSLNNETLTWLEKQAAERPVSARETARILRELHKTLSAEDRQRWISGIAEAREKMAHEHLH